MKRVVLIAAAATAAVACATATRAASTGVPTCPAHAPQTIARGPAMKHFVQPSATAMRLCRYYNINWGNDSQGLWQQRPISRSVTISRITRTFNGLGEPARGIYNCPMDDGSELLVVLGYPSGRVERVIVEQSGCRFAMNGRSTRWTTPNLQHRLVQLVKDR